MKSKNRLREVITKAVKEALYEGMYSKTATPELSKSDIHREIGVNPLITDKWDKVRQPSTFDTNGANFKGEHIIVSDNKFTFYKVKNFNNPDIKDTLSLFGGGANGEKELRRAIDIINGAAKRNNKFLELRTITSETNKKLSMKTSYMRGTFWEFSYGDEWYILKPNPVQNLKASKFKLKA